MKNDLYQTIIYEENCISTMADKLISFKDNLKVSGNLFIMIDNTYENGLIENSFFDFIELTINSGFKYINTIVFPVNDEGEKLKHNLKYLIWFAKDHNCMFFDKDKIREKHIWKDVEWGKRKKNYNEKGKDPSNVWIPTLDDGKGKITEHIILSKDEVFNRCIISTTKENEKVLIETTSFISLDKLILERDITIINNEETKEISTFNGYSKKTNKANFTGATVYFESSEYMKDIEKNTIALMVTSPPYWDLKNYFKDGQIGQESYEEYLIRLNKVWEETYRVLRDDGSMWININTRTKNKEPILIPHDIIKCCKEIGFKLKDIIIWHKSSGIPTHKNNLVDKHEYFLWFVKNEKYSLSPSGIEEIRDYRNDLLNNGLLWNINRKAGSVGKDLIHPAIYPTELIDRVIKLTTNENDIVMDPFLGSGTSMLSALRNKRNFIGYEYNEGFLDLMKYRISQENINLDLINFKFVDEDSRSKNIFRKDTNK